jgi:hypothetical protein
MSKTKVVEKIEAVLWPADTAMLYKFRDKDKGAKAPSLLRNATSFFRFTKGVNKFEISAN